MRGRLLVLLLAAAAGIGAPAAAAERYALLVGVSAMPALPRSAWLNGPRYDVPAMRSALLAQGFSATHIISLADGVDGATAPTRSAILAQLAQLGKTLRPDDVLVLYWSGHGLLMPGQPGVWQTPSGQQVHLLTRDARIDAHSRQLSGSISSADIGRTIDALAARQVHVVALFDSCYAAGSTRGDPGLAWRGLSSAALGWAPRPASLGGRRPASERADMPQPDSVVSPHERPLFIGFFAAEPQQRSAEALSSDYAGQARGIFTRALIAGLGDSPASYLAWASATNQHYREALDARQLPASARPSPVYAGTLEQALWTAAGAPVLWPVRQDGRGWYVPYGRLDGLQAGDLLQRGASTWRVTDVGWGEARLAVADSAATAGDGASRLLANTTLDGGSTGLQRTGVASTGGWASRLPANTAAASTASGGISAGASTVAILGRQGGARAVSVTLPGRSAVRLRLADKELPALRARAASIAALLALPSTAAAAPLLQARIEIQAPGQAAISLPFADRDLGPLTPGTRLRVVVENGGEDSVDAGIVHLPLSGPATRVFPPFEGDSNRLPPGTPVQISRFEREFEVTAQGAAGAPEWLALVAAPAVSGAMPRRFALLDALRSNLAAPAERGASLAAGHNPDQAQVARVSWRVATGGGQ
ncbi:caspase family protein [Duganella levis]|uniref:Peptidase C14 caspase domain-containing protein n=1 Tax=Duganella levis TaxID=2692169 RepID=A0ABW9W009_9BURK|nr:caspase family protein [Duganella levis]MYN27258.1 hypothetical protein [Duganella levis]